MLEFHLWKVELNDLAKANLKFIVAHILRNVYEDSFISSIPNISYLKNKGRGVTLRTIPRPANEWFLIFLRIYQPINMFLQLKTKYILIKVNIRSSKIIVTISIMCNMFKEMFDKCATIKTVYT